MNSSVTSWRSIIFRIVNGPRHHRGGHLEVEVARDLSASCASWSTVRVGRRRLVVLASEEAAELGVTVTGGDEHGEQLGELTLGGALAGLREQLREVLEGGRSVSGS